MGGFHLSRTNNKVRKFKKPKRLNMGAIAFFLIAVYILISFVNYLKKPRISIYEVVEKRLSNSYNCTGIALREEKIVRTKQAGYLSYYYSDSTKVGKDTVVYTIDETGKIYELLSSSDTDSSMSKSDRQQLWDNIIEFQQSYSQSAYDTVSDFTYNVENTVLQVSSSSLADSVNKILKENNLQDSYKSVATEQSGVLSYCMDGYEDKKPEDISLEDFEKSQYNKQQLRAADKVDKGAEVYKLVTGEDWTIVVDLSEELYNKMQDRISEDRKNGKETSYIDIVLKKENIQTTVPYELMKNGDGYFAKLSLNRFVIHYVNDRYVELELSLENAVGLKIPTTSVLKKEYYEIPASYITQGGENDKTGLVKEVYDQSGDVSYSFVEVSDYIKLDEETVLVDKSLFSAGEWIREEGTKERYQVAKTKKVKGVYCVNMGFCAFKRIEILYQNEEYCIVKEELNDGLSTFDHIVVDAKTVTEDDLINNFKSE